MSRRNVMGKAIEKREASGYARMGTVLDFKVRSAGYDHCLAMGLTKENAVSCVNIVAEQLERDKPFEAMDAGIKYLDLTGVYRLFAVLLTAEQAA